MNKLTFDQALERIGDERSIERADVLASALKRKIWCGSWHAPGCMSDHNWTCETRAGCIDVAIQLYAEDAPRGFISALKRDGIAGTDAQGYYRVSIERNTLADILYERARRL